jgi:hypothetical protein
MAKVIPIDGKDKIRLPGPTDRITITGHTGSGKSQAAMWHLSQANFDVKPWIIVDPKGEEKVAQIDGVEYIEVGVIPKHPGIYVVQPTMYESDELDNYFYDTLQHGNVGMYFDEAFLCGTGPGFTTLLIQGRSKRCPAITLNQRPVLVSRFAFSEAQFFQCFALTDDRDYKTLRGFAKIPELETNPLPEFWSYYYDVRWRRAYKMQPVPNIDNILDTIDFRMPARRNGTRKF